MSLLLIGCVWLMGCSEPSEDEFGLSAALVYGSVTRAGAPVVGAEVRVWAFLSTCPSTVGSLPSFQPVTTEAYGTYRKLLVGPVSPGTQYCLVVKALHPPPPDALDSALTSGALVRTVEEGAGPPDSVRVNLTIP